jgi:hypothetical protein
MVNYVIIIQYKEHKTRGVASLSGVGAIEAGETEGEEWRSIGFVK